MCKGEQGEKNIGSRYNIRRTYNCHKKDLFSNSSNVDLEKSSLTLGTWNRYKLIKESLAIGH